MQNWCIPMEGMIFDPLSHIEDAEASCPRASLVNDSEKGGFQVHKTTSLEM